MDTYREKMDMATLTLVALEGAMGSSLAITLDVLRTANQVAEAMGRPTITWQIVGSAESVRMRNGMHLQAVPLEQAKALESSMLVVPGWALRTPRNSIRSDAARSRAKALGRFPPTCATDSDTAISANWSSWCRNSSARKTARRLLLCGFRVGRGGYPARADSDHALATI